MKTRKIIVDLHVEDIKTKGVDEEEEEEVEDVEPGGENGKKTVDEACELCHEAAVRAVVSEDGTYTDLIVPENIVYLFRYEGNCVRTGQSGGRHHQMEDNPPLETKRTMFAVVQPRTAQNCALDMVRNSVYPVGFPRVHCFVFAGGSAGMASSSGLALHRSPSSQSIASIGSRHITRAWTDAGDGKSWRGEREYSRFLKKKFPNCERKHACSCADQIFRLLSTIRQGYSPSSIVLRI